MTRVIVKPETSSRQVASVYAHVAEAALSLRAAVDAAEGAMQIASIIVLDRLRQRVSAIAGELEGSFTGREPCAPFGDRQDPRAWLRWLDSKGHNTDDRSPRPESLVGAGRMADTRSLEPSKGSSR